MKRGIVIGVLLAMAVWFFLQKRASDQQALFRERLLSVPDSTHKIPHGIVTRLPTGDSVLALTFDGCESSVASYFDTTILTTLLSRRIPFTMFLGGAFAMRNRHLVDSLSKLDFVEIENHSYHHKLHMEALPDSVFDQEILATDDSLQTITDSRSQFFRFPGGFYDERALKRVEELGYRVVHWTFESGDPDKKITPEKLKPWVLEKTKPGSILIFHINRRGYSTGKALPDILDAFEKRGYRFVLLKDYL